MLTYNCIELTKQAVADALAQDIPTHLWVMDDGSTDGTLPYLRSLPRVSVCSSRHRGVSAMWNIGLNPLFHNGVPHVLVVNNDVRLRPDTYCHLRDDGGLFVTCVGTSDGALWPGGEPSGRTRPHPDFSCYLIRKECWDRVGEFDEAMRSYCSDGDYHLRMHKAGIEAYCLDLSFYHYASGTLKNVSEADRLRILKQAELDREAFERKWGCAMGSVEYYDKFKKEVKIGPASAAQAG